MSTTSAMSEAIQAYQAGNIAGAEWICRQLLAADPFHADGWHLLGLISFQTGRQDAGLDQIRKAISLKNGESVYHANLGNAFQLLGRYEEAAAAYRQAVALQPLQAGNHNNLGGALLESGNFAEAVSCYQRAIELEPNNAEARFNLGNAWRRQGRDDLAGPCFEQAIRLRPDYAAAHNNLGNLYRRQSRFEEALTCYRRALSVEPNSPGALENLGAVLLQLRRFDEAEGCLQSALQIEPMRASAHANLGGVFLHRGRFSAAEERLRHAVGLSPSLAFGHGNLGSLLRQTGRTAEAITSLRKAIELDPTLVEAYNDLSIIFVEKCDFPNALGCLQDALRLSPQSIETRTNLGNAYLRFGNVGRAVEYFREALKLDPQFAKSRSNLLMALTYDPSISSEELLAEHRRFGELHESSAVLENHQNLPVPERRLRVGYVSPDFRRHPVTSFFESVLASHDPQIVEITLYAEVAKPDKVSERLQSLTRQWRNTCGLTDAELAQQVREDGIDILVDLAGHTADNRLLAFAHRPAPVQVTWLGYPNTTGLKSIKYRLADDLTDPPSEPSRYTEQLVHLLGGYCCYQTPSNAPEVRPLPALSSGHVTFGSLHTLAKLNPQVIDLWCRVLRAIPSSRLLVFRDALRGEIRDSLARVLVDRGIPADRFELRSQSPEGGHWAVYHEIDVSLDVFPWCGHTTACESLWMGVPILTLYGLRHAGRLVASVLRSAGLPEWIAYGEEQYVALAMEAARDLERLARLRASLRQQMLRSSLCDGPLVAGGVEKAYRQMWREWCERHRA